MRPSDRVRVRQARYCSGVVGGGAVIYKSSSNGSKRLSDEGEGTRPKPTNVRERNADIDRYGVGEVALKKFATA